MRRKRGNQLMSHLQSNANGNTLKGSDLKKQHNYLNGKDNSYQSTTTASVHTNFYLGRDNEIHRVTLQSLRKEMQDCSTALTQIDEEFKETYWYKHPTANINHYRALIRICEIYKSARFQPIKNPCRLSEGIFK